MPGPAGLQRPAPACKDGAVRLLLVTPTLLHAGPDPRTIRCRRLLAGLPQRGFEVDVVSWWAGPGPAPDLDCRRLHALRSRSPYEAIAAGEAHGPEGLGEWIDDAERTLAGLGKGERPDVVLGVGVPLASLVAAERVARRLAVPFVADLGDPWTPADPAEQALRARTLGAAAALITTTGALAATLTGDLRPDTPVLIAPAGGETARRPAEPRDPPLFVQLGTLTAGRVDPRPAYEALGGLDSEGRIEFRSHGAAWLEGSERLPHPHLPPVGHEEALELAGQAAAVLVLGNTTSSEQLPSKAFEVACTEAWALCVSELGDDPAVAVLRRSGHAVEAAANEVAAIRAAAEEILVREANGKRPEPDPGQTWERRLDDIAELLTTAARRRATGNGA